MPRPLPSIPRGPRRRRAADAERQQLFACPRVAPDWELGALRALMKPQEKGRILHRPAGQRWPRGAGAVVQRTCDELRERLLLDARPALPEAGDYFLVMSVPEREAEGARALAVLLSARLPELWFVLGRLFVRAGRFYRRERGWKLNLVPASNVHLTRAARAAIRGL